jgi:hypothetical protein
MGIRFYCPNGHKLNVKDVQAGQKGICPVCGVRMQIPLQSTRPSSKHDEPHPQEVAPAPTEPELTPSPPAVPTETPTDPLAESGSAVWYVRPPSGGQFGPAQADVLRHWIAEGRVSADTLVWREGWRDWQEAGGIFPQLAAVTLAPDLEEIVAETASESHPQHLQPPAKRRQLPSPQSILIGVLSAAVVVLIIVLLIVLHKS